MSSLEVHVPSVFTPLLQPSRYKAAHGGRGGGKSHFFAEQLVLRCLSGQTRAVCIREVQNTIKESVKQLIEDKIQRFGLGAFFKVLETEIRGPHDSLIIFKGMQAYNAANIKSLEGFDIAWVEEAQTLSAISWRLLRPTIRKAGSEIWVSWNPRHDTDAVDEFFRGPGCPPDATVIEVNWQDNPWFGDGTMPADMAADFALDPEMAEHVWNGGYEVVSEGAYYAKAIVQAEKEGRVGNFLYDPTCPVHTAWDLGVDDYTAIWFVQDNGQYATILDYYEINNEGAPQIIAACIPELFIPPQLDEQFIGWNAEAALKELGRERPYQYGYHFFPHDLKMREWGAGARSRVETVRALGLRSVRKGAATGPHERINAVRRVLPVCRFAATARVNQGLKRLRRYRRKWNDNLQTYTSPEHDENSHGADAFGEWAVNSQIKPEKIVTPKPAKDELQIVATPDGRLQANMSVIDVVMARKKKRLAHARR